MPTQQLRKAPLSRRETDIAGLVAEGLTNREIAQRLFISERTVESHLEHVREKLAVKSRAQVATWFVAQSTANPTMTKSAPSNMPPAVPQACIASKKNQLAQHRESSRGLTSVHRAPPSVVRMARPASIAHPVVGLTMLVGSI
jgi:DNA-binding CsgD family transcriptional regulator